MGDGIEIPFVSVTQEALRRCFDLDRSIKSADELPRMGNISFFVCDGTRDYVLYKHVKMLKSRNEEY